MSASPSGLSNGTPTPNGGPPQYIRKARGADPLRARKKPPRRAELPPDAAAKKAKGPIALRHASPAKFPQQPHAQPNLHGRIAHGGWTHPPAGAYQDFPLFTTKRALREGLRYHVARLASKKEVDVRNQAEFIRPVTLLRRDPRQPAKGVAQEEDPEDELDSKERERQEILKAEKDAKRAAEQAQIAPTGNSASAIAAKKAQAFKNEKTTQVHRLDKTEAQKKESDLRYEEALPWHLEDAENKNTWVGNYEAALSNANVVFVIEGGVFKMIPIEKWYKFTQKNQFKGFTIEEAEAQFNRKDRQSRWAMKTQENTKSERELAETRQLLGNLYTVKSESNTFKNARKGETQDADDLDFDGDDLFQDDDEMPNVVPDQDEDAKESKDRIKREQLGANVFDQADEADVDKELLEEEKEAERTRKLGKSLKKALTKREKMTIYESDDENPYASTSEDDTSDEEKQKEIDKRKDEEAKAKAKLEASKTASGSSSKGANTPSGRPKHSDPMKSKTLKRAGSPNLSESSGNESSRKKQKKWKHSSQPTISPAASRPMSPAPSSSAPPGQSPRKSSIIKLNVNPTKLSDIQAAPPNPSPMSDGEATGGEMSDGGQKKKKIKLRLGGASPTGSRPGSPAPGRAGSIGAEGSRAGSPALSNNTARANSPTLGPITAPEIAAALPKDGISIGNLMKLFSGRVGDVKGQQTSKQEFIKMVKENSAYGADKLLRPK